MKETCISADIPVLQNNKVRNHVFVIMGYLEIIIILFLSYIFLVNV